MRILAIEIDEFRRLHRVRLEPPDGLIAVVGPNGAGKTTILEAVSWALFGHDAARTGRDLIKRAGSSPADPCRVRVVLEAAGHRIDVERELRGAGLAHDATMRVDGTVVVAAGANSAREVSAKVASLLGLDRTAFFATVVARQRELDLLSSLQPGARRELVLRMLGVEAIDGAIVRVRATARERRAAIQEIQRATVPAETLAERAKAVDAQRATVAASERVAAKRVAAGVKALDAARAASAALRPRRDEAAGLDLRIAARRARLEAREQETARLSARLDEARVALRGLAALGDVDAALATARATLGALQAADAGRAERDRATTDAAALAQRVRTLAAALATPIDVEVADCALADARARVAEAEAALPALDARIAAATAERRHATAQAEAARRHIERLAETPDGGACPTCLRPLGEHGATLRRRLHDEAVSADEAARAQATELKRTRTEREATLARLLGLRTARDAAESSAAATRHAGATRAAAAEAHADAVARLRSIEARRDELDRLLPPSEALASASASLRAAELCWSERERLRAAADTATGIERELATIRDDAAKAAASLDALVAARASLDAELARLVQAESATESAHAELRAAESAAATARAARATLAASEETLATDTRRATEAATRLQELADECAHLDALAPERGPGLLSEFRTAFVARLAPYLSSTASAIFQDLTDGRYQGLELDADYALHVIDGGKALPLARFSGGENDLANLALRLALSQALAHRAGLDAVHTLVLDEVFGGLDRSRRIAVLRALARLRSRFRQIWLITHIEDVRESVDHVLAVRDGDNPGESEVVLQEGVGEAPLEAPAEAL